MEDEVVLLDTLVSMFGMRVRIALAEKGVAYEYKEENLPYSKSPLLIQMNPLYKKIPVLIHNEKPICESLIIVQYIDEVWNHKSPLMPTNPYHRAQARFWADFIDKKVYHSGRAIWETTGEEQESFKKEFIETLKILEEQLGDKPYFDGDKFGFIDLALITYYPWFEAIEIYGNFKVEEHCPVLIEWCKRCMDKETVSNTLVDPKKAHDFVVILRKRLGLQ